MTGFIPRLLPAVLLGLSAPVFAAQAPATIPAQPSPAAMDTYVIDPDHSRATFEIKHMYVSTVQGRFAKLQGTIHLNPKDISKSDVEVTIDAASITTDTDMRDKDLRSPNFFDVAKYTTITFTSSKVTDLGGGALKVEGPLTIHGITRPVTIMVNDWTVAQGAKPGTFLAGFGKGSTQILRSDFDIKHLMGPVGDKVDITLSVEAKKAQPAQ